MHLTPLAWSFLLALLAVAYVCSCLFNLIRWCFEAGQSTL